MLKIASRAAMIAAVASLSGCALWQGLKPVDLSPRTWSDDYQRFMQAQLEDRDRAGMASGQNGAVTVAYNGLAARAGLEALKQGGTAADAALTAAMAQVALTAGAPVSYFGILSLVYYDAKSDRVYTMNAEWNTLQGETDPLTIPGGFDLRTAEGRRGLGDPSGRTALVGGFMRGVEAAHQRFGKLPWAQLFEPSIHVAQNGIPISGSQAKYWAMRREDLARLPETAAILLKADGSAYEEGDIFRQPALAGTLRRLAEQGADYMHSGPWAGKLVRAVQADGGKMTLKDLADYQVIWAEPLAADLDDEYRVYTNPWPNSGGVALIEAQNLAREAGIPGLGQWWRNGESLKRALDVSMQAFITYLPEQMQQTIYPGMDLSPAARATPEHAKALWPRMQAGAKLGRFVPQGPKHSDDVVAVDRWGNMAAITHSINTVIWGKTAINIDGISIADAASFQQAAVAATGPGQRLPAPTETGILFRNGEPYVAFASMGAGLHQRTMQCLLGITEFDYNVVQAINAPDFFLPQMDVKTFQSTAQVLKGAFPAEVLAATGYKFREVELEDIRLAGEGLWVGISRDPVTGELLAGSHNRNNSAAVAY